LPLHDDPIRVAEEIAMLDVISGGRIISGFVRGTGMEYYSYGVNPVHSRERFYEAHDLILRAWTEPGPFPFVGKHYRYRYVNPWPRPLQQPHPPIWLPGTGSLETIDEAAKYRYPFMMVFAPLWFTKTAYVAETDEKAHAEARDHIMWLFHRGLKIPDYHWFPPGYMSGKSLGNMLQ